MAKRVFRSKVDWWIRLLLGFAVAGVSVADQKPSITAAKSVITAAPQISGSTLLPSRANALTRGNGPGRNTARPRRIPAAAAITIATSSGAECPTTKE